MDEEGRWVRGKAMKDRFLDHFKDFLGTEHYVDLKKLDDDLFSNRLD